MKSLFHSTPRPAGALSALSLACLLLACAGVRKGGDNAGTGGNGNGDGGGSGPGPGLGGMGPGPGPGPSLIGACSADAKPSVGPTPVRRITSLEYNNAARDLFGDLANPASASGFPSDERVGSFVSNTKTPLSSTNNEGYLTAAEGVASRFVTRFATASGCAAGDTACVEAFLLGLARRAFHGTLDADASAALKALYERVSQKLDASAGVEAVVRSVLLSPRFLFMIEFGAPEADISRLTQPEVAGRLAAYLWRTVPDLPLLALADSGALGSADQIKRQAEAMLADPRAQPMLDDFALQWLEIEDIQRISRDDAAFTPALRDAMMKETTLTFENAARAASTSFAQLLTSPTSYVNGDLAALYGIPGPSVDFAPTQMPANRRGILMQGAFLATQAHPQTPSQVLRGKAVREQLLCDHIDSPPPGVERNIAVPGDMTSQQAFDAHTSVQPCAGCHQWLDPIGRGFGFFDNIGRYREIENGKPLTSKGEIVAGPTSPVTGTFSGALELAQLLASNEYVQQCFAVQATRFALGRDERDADACSVKAAWDAFKAGQLGIHQLFVAVTGTTAFSHRNTVRAGMICQ